MIASDIMDRSAALLNDIAKSVFNYPAQIPFLNMAMDELQELFEENNIPSTNEVSAVLPLLAGITQIDGTNGLPADLIEIQSIGERDLGSVNSFFPLTRVEFLPSITTPTSGLGWFAWRDQVIKFIGSTVNLEIEIKYIKSLFTIVADGTETISVINCKSFLAYRTAGLVASFVGENPERAEELNTDAVLALARTLNIGTKGRQSIATRRRPFLANFRLRGYSARP